MLTTLCGTFSVASLGLAFILGSKHGYLVYAGATAALLLRNQQQAYQDIREWLRDEYFAMKEFVMEYAALKTGQKRPAQSKKSSRKSGKTAGQQQLLPQQVASAMEKLGATSLTNCLVSGIAFGIASIGVFGDMD